MKLLLSKREVLHKEIVKQYGWLLAELRKAGWVEDARWARLCV